MFSLERGDNQKRGPFYLGIFGVVARVGTLAWSIFAVVIYSFPFNMPATAESESNAILFTGSQRLLTKNIRYELCMCNLWHIPHLRSARLVLPRQKGIQRPQRTRPLTRAYLVIR